MKKVITVFAVAILLLCMGSRSYAHFGMLIPSDSMVMQNDRREIRLDVSFSHPFEMMGMEMDRPVQFKVNHKGNVTDLTASLKETEVMGHRAWTMDFMINRPGIYSFYMEPVPYWEPGEDCYIIHYTKSLVAAFGAEEGWDEPVGLKTEIVPVSRPFGLYAGNVFQGIVMLDNRPVPFAEVEIEYYNRNGKAKAPTEYMITQVVKADSNGLFTYAVPRAGWWGFAALNTSNEKITHEGEEKDIELGAVLWVEFLEWQED